MKNTFAELLSEVISNSEISKNEMIRECDIDRSSFFKFIAFDRIHKKRLSFQFKSKK